MTEEEKLKLRLALRIISGRSNLDILRDCDNDKLVLLGFDPWNFSYYGKPTHNELKERAEDIIFYFLTRKEVADAKGN